MSAPPKKSQFPDNIEQLDQCKNFLVRFTDAEGRAKYMEMLQEVANRERGSVEIALDDVQLHAPQLVRQVEDNAVRLHKLFCQAVDAVLPAPTVDLAQRMQEGQADIYDVWLSHRMDRLRNIAPGAPAPGDGGAAGVAGGGALPVELLRRYELHVVPRGAMRLLPLRAIRSEQLGTLVGFKGIVTKITDVQPLVEMVTYICNRCGYESYQSTPGRAYTPLNVCPAAACKENNNPGRLTALSRGSKFQRYQELRVQELPAEVPVGHIPRSMAAKLYGSLTRSAVPGDIVTLSGVFLPVPFEGFRAIRAGLTANTYVEVWHVRNHRKQALKDDLTPDILREIEERAQEKDIYSTLAASLAPEIFGHVDVKKALLLLLVGGVTRNMKDGMKIRGDINVLMMGDPGVAKSQLLKHASRVAARAVYTTGKGSTGVGLTAAVTRDPVTHETSLEGGALVLADMGICCIDEFDKMEEGDRTAIHEVMEQQSVSIAKAGITTTLNARTAILAAANPLMGRWNKKESFERNVNLETALLSRFDLIFLMLDSPEAAGDLRLSEHVLYVHTHGRHPPAQETAEAMPTALLRHYIARAREAQPFVPPELTEFILSSYVAMRQESNEETKFSAREREGPEANTRKRFCTARSLLAILRLSQAMAKVHLRDVVQREDVEEAMRLIAVSRVVDEDDEDAARRKQQHGIAPGDYKSAILMLIRRHAATKGSSKVMRHDILPSVLRRFTEQQLDETLDVYQDLTVLTLDRGRQTIQLILNQA